MNDSVSFSFGTLSDLRLDGVEVVKSVEILNDFTDKVSKTCRGCLKPMQVMLVDSTFAYDHPETIRRVNDEPVVWDLCNVCSRK